MAQQPALRWRDLKTGLLFFFGITLALILGLYIGKNTGLLAGHKYVYVFVKDIKGVTESNLVSISGKKVGTVDYMEFKHENGVNGILMRLKIREEYFPLITRGTRAVIKSLGVLGDKYVDLSLGQSTDRIANNARIEIGEDPDDLMASASETMKNINSLTSQIAEGQGSIGKLVTSTELTDRVNESLANLSMVLASVNSGRGVGPALLHDQQLAGNIRGTLTNLGEISAMIKEGDGALGKFLLGQEFFAKVNALSSKTDSLLTQIGNKDGSLAKFSQDQEVYNNVNTTMISLKKTVGSLDSVLVDLKQNPSKYINVKIIDF